MILLFAIKYKINDYFFLVLCVWGKYEKYANLLLRHFLFFLYFFLSKSSILLFVAERLASYRECPLRKFFRLPLPRVFVRPNTMGWPEIFWKITWKLGFSLYQLNNTPSIWKIIAVIFVYYLVLLAYNYYFLEFFRNLEFFLSKKFLTWNIQIKHNIIKFFKIQIRTLI